MKKLVLFILLFSNFISYSQHPDLLQRWYVQSITINGTTSTILVDNMTFPYTFLDFYTGSGGLILSRNEFLNYYNTCVVGFGGHVSYFSNEQFIFTDFTPSQNFNTCNANIIDFMSMYIEFFNSTIQNNFNYSITNGSNNSLTLTITNSTNDYITLTNKFLTPPPPQLYENGFWFLHKLIINNVTYDAIFISPDIAWADFNIIPDDVDENLYMRVCLDLFGGVHHFDYSTSQFYLYSPFEEMYNCAHAVVSQSLHDMNIGFFMNYAPGPFHYSVNGNNPQELQLIITNPSGYQAIYGNYPLSTESLLESSFNIYPNPFQNQLTIEPKNNIGINTIQVFNTLGQELLSTKLTEIDFSSFSKGTYFIKIETNNGFVINNVVLKD